MAKKTAHFREGVSNKEMLLRSIIETGGCSRASLQQSSGLSIMTVKNIVDTLSADGIVTEKKAESDVGRKPLYVYVKPSLGDIACLDVSSPEEITAACFTLDGACTDEYSYAVDNKLSYSQNLSLVFDRLKRHNRKLLGIGLAVAGSYNPKTGRASHSVAAGYENIDFSALLLREFPEDTPFVVAGDMQLAAACEAKQRDTGSLVYLYFGQRVAGGVLSDTDVTTGEIGCSLAAEGSFQQLLATAAIAEKHKKTFGEVWQRFEKGEAKPTASMETAARAVSQYVHNLVCLLSPAYIVIDSDSRPYAHYLAKEAEAFCTARAAETPLRLQCGVEAAKSPRKCVYGGLHDILANRLVKRVCGRPAGGRAAQSLY